MVSERMLQQQIIQIATLYHWLVFHDFDSRRNAPGFPDLVLCKQANGNVAQGLHKQGLLFVELKSERGRLRPEQEIWIEALRSAGQEVYVWRPSDLDAAIERLSTDRTGRTVIHRG